MLCCCFFEPRLGKVLTSDTCWGVLFDQNQMIALPSPPFLFIDWCLFINMCFCVHLMDWEKKSLLDFVKMYFTLFIPLTTWKGFLCANVLFLWLQRTRSTIKQTVDRYVNHCVAIYNTNINIQKKFDVCELIVFCWIFKSCHYLF